MLLYFACDISVLMLIFSSRHLELKNVFVQGKELPPIVVIVGKDGSGKSAFLQNIFNFDTESGMGTDSVTK